MNGVAVVYIILEIFSGYFLYRELEDGMNKHILLTIPAVLFYLLTCCKEVHMLVTQPGYANFDDLQLIDELPIPTSSSIQSSSHSMSELPSNDAKPIEIEMKYCKYCKHQRLLRMKHCYDCHRCVATFDHHCIWVGNCIAQKNRSLFYLTITFNFVAITNAFCMLVAQMWRKGEKQTYQIFFLSFLGILIGALVALVGMHSYMMVVNLTTWQLVSWRKMDYFRGHPWKKGSPFSFNCCRNVKEYWTLPFTRLYKKWIVNPKYFNK